LTFSTHTNLILSTVTARAAVYQVRPVADRTIRVLDPPVKKKSSTALATGGALFQTGAVGWLTHPKSAAIE